MATEAGFAITAKTIDDYCGAHITPGDSPFPVPGVHPGNAWAKSRIEGGIGGAAGSLGDASEVTLGISMACGESKRTNWHPTPCLGWRDPRV
eukprot:9498940-Pyramimonas_sp.AAC.1